MEADDRFIKSIREVIQALIPQLEYTGVHEYLVVTGSPVTGYVLRSTNPQLPDLSGVNIWQATGTTAFIPGARVLVAFINNDPARPTILQDGAVIRHGDSLAFVTTGTYIVTKTVLP
jgi:hypothetical protein